LEAEALPRALGHRITALRHIHGITQGELARRLGVAQSFVSQVERGSRSVPDAVLGRAIDQFALPRAFFTIMPNEADMGPVTFRKNSRASALDERRIVELFNEASRLYRHLGEASRYRTATLPNPSDFDADPERVAEAMRAAAGLGPDEPVGNAVRAVERLGVGVVDNLEDLDDTRQGHTAVSRPNHMADRPLIALVVQVPGAVKRLTVLHELGHLIFDRDLTEPVSIRSREEKRAYRFASAYLLPARVVRERVSESVNLHGYLPLKADYGISVGAIIVRARDLGAISAERARSLQIQLAAQRWRYDEPVNVPDERPLLLGQALARAYGAHYASRAAEHVGVRVDWVRRWTHAEPASEPEVPAASEASNIIDLAAVRASRSA
jgi:Zn-dependent peptidase ImmA (M78 family)/transcriptional regulator with XRE-family HTH domain